MVSLSQFGCSGSITDNVTMSNYNVVKTSRLLLTSVKKKY